MPKGLYPTGKYITERKDPPTEAEAELLSCLSEEAGEIVKEVSKCNRSGFGHIPPSNPVASNRHRLEEEVGDLLAVVGVLQTFGVIDAERVSQAKAYKRERLGFFLIHTDIPTEVTSETAEQREARNRVQRFRARYPEIAALWDDFPDEITDDNASPGTYPAT